MPEIDWNICLPLSFGSPDAAPLTLSHAPTDAPQRTAFEAFIQTRFQKAHGANIKQFMPELFGLSDGSGALCAVAGARLATAGALFLERYLDEPIEHQVHRAAGRPVERQAIVEVGNLAASNLGSARLSIITVTWLLAICGLEWVTFTGNNALVNSFNRLGLCPVTLGPADPLRLGDDRHAWGNYYQTQPNVHVGDIGAGFRHLSNTGVFERFGLPLALEEHCHVA
ncbi:thermostable hemolysin [Pseudomonas viridiflava]|uniref:thermostable hemolysin n=1 Tax=Pseudomonas viridiflava TaxID=33069 RepID=UPI000F02CC70|nr:thermostable hemolysin [Pseudomonas viridiflava]